MKWIILICLLAVATSIYPAGQLDDVPATDLTMLEKAIGPERAKALGLAKLTQAEVAEWMKLIKSTSPSSLESSAAAYMKNAGWEGIVYNGDTSQGGKTYAVFTFGLLNDSYAVEKPILISLLPGQYFAKVSILGDGLDRIIDARGREHQFLLDKWIKVSH